MKNIILFTIGMLLLMGSCKSKSDSEVEVIESEIISISAPNKAISNDNVKIEVTFYGLNGCSKPFDIKATKVGQTITLRAYYSQPTEQSICTEILPLHKLTYTYFADFPGSYFFQSSQNSTVGDTLVVY